MAALGAVGACALAWYVVSAPTTASSPDSLRLGVDVENGRLDRARTEVNIPSGAADVRVTLSGQAECNRDAAEVTIKFDVPPRATIRGGSGLRATQACAEAIEFAIVTFTLPREDLLHSVAPGRWQFNVDFYDYTSVKLDPSSGNLWAQVTTAPAQRIEDVYGAPFIRTPTNVVWFASGTANIAGSVVDPAEESRSGLRREVLLLVIGAVLGALSSEALRGRARTPSGPPLASFEAASPPTLPAPSAPSARPGRLLVLIVAVALAWLWSRSHQKRTNGTKANESAPMRASSGSRSDGR